MDSDAQMNVRKGPAINMLESLLNPGFPPSF